MKVSFFNGTCGAPGPDIHGHAQTCCCIHGTDQDAIHSGGPLGGNWSDNIWVAGRCGIPYFPEKETSPITKTPNIYAGMWRPPRNEVVPRSPGYVMCNCGAVLQCQEQILSHYQSGHFDRTLYRNAAGELVFEAYSEIRKGVI
jgi:hypothetical protein